MHPRVSFAIELPLLFAITGVLTGTLATGIRRRFRKGKSITDL